MKMDEDAQFFKDHPDRYAHIRLPRMVLERTPQRAMHYVEEMRGEFWSLGEHNKDRRRIGLYRLPENSPFFDPKKPIIMRIPFLLFADETVEDRDDILLPIIHEIMISEAKRYGAK